VFLYRSLNLVPDTSVRIIDKIHKSITVWTDYHLYIKIQHFGNVLLQLILSCVHIVVPMIEISADNKRFFVTRQTLNNDPSFIITQMVNGQIPNTSCKYVEAINDHTYRIDIVPTVLETIINILRLLPSTSTLTSTLTSTSTPTPEYVKRMTNILFTPKIEPEIETKTESAFSPTDADPDIDNDVLSKLETGMNQYQTTRPQSTSTHSSIFSKSKQTDRYQNQRGNGRNYVDFSVTDDTDRFYSSDINTDKQDRYLNDLLENFLRGEKSSTSSVSFNVPKGHHVLKSRKIEIDTSEDMA